MHTPRLGLALLGLVLLLGVFAPRPAASGVLKTRWSLPGLVYRASLGNTDSDPQPELLCVERSFRYAVVDGATGQIQQGFNSFNFPDAGCTAADINGDGRNELFFNRAYGGPPIFTAYQWNGTSYAQMYTHTDLTYAYSIVHLRTPGQTEVLEIGATDIRVRAMNGTVLWRASTSLPGWTGNNPNASAVDMDNDGTPELQITRDASTVDVVRYSGGAFSRAWGVTGWLPMSAFNSDADSQNEIAMFSATDGHFAIFDGRFGYMEYENTAYSFFTGGDMLPFDSDGDGQRELFFYRQGPGTPCVTAVRGGCCGYNTMWTHNSAVSGIFPATSRSTVEHEIVEIVTGNFRIRDAETGDVLFTASTGLFPWSGSAPDVSLQDANHDGVSELAVTDATNALRLVSGESGFYHELWSVPGWQFYAGLGDTDGDPADEYMLRQVSTGSTSLVDGMTGAPATVVPDWNAANGVAYLANDPGGYGVNNILSYRPSFSGSPARLRQYGRTANFYTVLFSHTDPVFTAAAVRLRTAGQGEILEVAPDDDLRLRDGQTGAMLFQGSVGAPEWSGVDMTANTPFVALNLDPDDDANELLINEHSQLRMIDEFTFADAPPSSRPVAFALMPGSPNPFRSSVALRFALPADGPVRVRIFDAAGRLVRQMDQAFTAGNREFVWDGADESGSPAPSGILFYEVTAAGVKKTSRIVRLP